MADDRKRVNAQTVRMTDAEFLALGREAARDDRTIGDLLHAIVRRHLFGSMGQPACAGNAEPRCDSMRSDA